MTDHTDPDDPTSMALPVIGDTVLLTDGTTSKIRSRVGNTWKVQDDLTDHEHIVTIDQIAGYPDDVAWVRGQFEPAPEDAELIPTADLPCEHTTAHHGIAGTELTGCDECGATWPFDAVSDQAPAELPADELVAGVLNAAMDWHAATQAGSFLDHCLASDTLHDAVRAYLPLVGK